MLIYFITGNSLCCCQSTFYINKLLGGVFNFLFSWAGFFFWLQDGDNIWVLDLWSVQSTLVVRFENLDFDSQNTLSEEDVSDGGINVAKTFGWETGVDHHTVGEFHTLGSCPRILPEMTTSQPRAPCSIT